MHIPFQETNDLYVCVKMLVYRNTEKKHGHVLSQAMFICCTSEWTSHNSDVNN